MYHDRLQLYFGWYWPHRTSIDNVWFCKNTRIQRICQNHPTKQTARKVIHAPGSEQHRRSALGLRPTKASSRIPRGLFRRQTYKRLEKTSSDLKDIKYVIRKFMDIAVRSFASLCVGTGSLWYLTFCMMYAILTDSVMNIIISLSSGVWKLLQALSSTYLYAVMTSNCNKMATDFCFVYCSLEDWTVSLYSHVFELCRHITDI